MKSKLFWRQKKYKETSNLLENIKIDAISETRKRDYLQLKAKHFEKLKKFDEAYACFAQCNLLVRGPKNIQNIFPNSIFKNWEIV